MSYTIIYKNYLFKENGRIYLFTLARDNNIWPKPWHNDYSFITFENDAEYIKFCNGYTGEGNSLKKNGKWLSYYDYGKYLLKKLNKPDNINYFNIEISQLLGFENKENNLYFDPESFIELNYKCHADAELMNKYRELSFKKVWKNNLKLSDLNNDLKNIQVYLRLDSWKKKNLKGVK